MDHFASLADEHVKKRPLSWGRVGGLAVLDKGNFGVRRGPYLLISTNLQAGTLSPLLSLGAVRRVLRIPLRTISARTIKAFSCVLTSDLSTSQFQ